MAAIEVVRSFPDLRLRFQILWES